MISYFMFMLLEFLTGIPLGLYLPFGLQYPFCYQLLSPNEVILWKLFKKNDIIYLYIDVCMYIRIY